MDISLCKFHGIKIIQPVSTKHKNLGVSMLADPILNTKYGFILSKQSIIRKSSLIQEPIQTDPQKHLNYDNAC